MWGPPRHPELAALVEESALTAAVDALLEGHPYEQPGPKRRPQVLFTLPNAQTWTVPSGWHSDRPRLAATLRQAKATTSLAARSASFSIDRPLEITMARCVD